MCAHTSGHLLRMLTFKGWEVSYIFVCVSVSVTNISVRYSIIQVILD